MQVVNTYFTSEGGNLNHNRSYCITKKTILFFFINRHIVNFCTESAE